MQRVDGLRLSQAFSRRQRPIAATTLLLLTVCGSAVTAAGCRDGRTSEYFGTTQRAHREPSTLYVNNYAEPEYLDPGLAADQPATVLLQELFEGLVVLHPRDLHPTQGVASRWEQTADNRFFRFHLRRDARWSDGQPVTAQDFAYSWQRVLTAKTAARMATTMYCIKNGQLYHQGKLKVLAKAKTLNPSPTESPGSGSPLPAGSPVQVLATVEQDSRTWALVEAFADYPRFYRPPALPDRDNEGAKPKGYVPLDSLEADPQLLGIRAADAHTLEVELAKPTPYFIELLSYVTFFPVRQDIIEKFEKTGQPDRWFRPENMVSNGPYMIDRWQFRYQISMKQNPYYHGRAKLALRRIVWLEVPDSFATMNLYKTAEIDYLGSNTALPAAYLYRLSKKKDFKQSQYLATYWYSFNVTKAPLNDRRVRRALNLAINKKLLVERITRSGQVPATHYVPDYTGSGYAAQATKAQRAGTDPFSGKTHAFNPEVARQYLREAGYEVVSDGGAYRTTGFPSLEILYNTSEGHRKIAVAVQDMWKRHLGIHVGLRNLEWKVFLRQVRTGHFQIAALSWNADYNHPHTWLETLLSYSHNNWTGWKNTEFDELVEKAAATADPEQSIVLYRRAEQLAVGQLPRLPMYFFTKSTLVKPYVKGFFPNPKKYHPVRFMWIDPRWQQDAKNRPAYDPPDFPLPGRIE